MKKSYMGFAADSDTRMALEEFARELAPHEWREGSAMYVNTYVLAVPEEKRDDYLRIAKRYAEIAKDHGAIEVCENWELEVPDGEQTDYRKAVLAGPGEKIVVSWTIWPDRETGFKAHRAMPEDPRFGDMGPMPFDGKRMILGGFEPLTRWRKE